MSSCLCAWYVPVVWECQTWGCHGAPHPGASLGSWPHQPTPLMSRDRTQSEAPGRELRAEGRVAGGRPWGQGGGGLGAWAWLLSGRAPRQGRRSRPAPTSGRASFRSQAALEASGGAGGTQPLGTTGAPLLPVFISVGLVSAGLTQIATRMSCTSGLKIKLI